MAKVETGYHPIRFMQDRGEERVASLLLPYDPVLAIIVKFVVRVDVFPLENLAKPTRPGIISRVRDPTFAKLASNN